MQEFTLSDLGVFLGVVGDIMGEHFAYDPKEQVQEAQVLWVRV
jgi:hypothetical protein